MLRNYALLDLRTRHRLRVEVRPLVFLPLQKHVWVPVGSSAHNASSYLSSRSPPASTGSASRRPRPASRDTLAARAKDSLHLEDRQVRVLAEDLGYNTSDVRCSEAVSGRRLPAPVRPGHPHVDPKRPELDRGLWVVVEEVWVLDVMRRYREDGDISGGVAGTGHVVRGCYQHHVAKVGLIGYLVEYPEKDRCGPLRISVGIPVNKVTCSIALIKRRKFPILLALGITVAMPCCF